MRVATAEFALPASLAAQYFLTTSTCLPFPKETQSSTDAQNFIVSQWSLSEGRISYGGSDITFVTDPFLGDPVLGSAENSTVLRITYPSQSYSGETGGAQWYTRWKAADGSTFQSALLSYELAFDSNFNWVKGGKLPGLRGGPDSYGCSGGRQPDGNDCFSARLMWRAGGLGEVYAYMLSLNDLCSDNNIVCNSDYGISVGRGSFRFVSGQWQRISVLVQMNSPGFANGNLILYFNDTLVMSQQNLQFRSGTRVSIGGMIFSTFFGGADSSWATPQTVHAYFRNFQLYGGSVASDLTGQGTDNAMRLACSPWTLIVAWMILFHVFLQ